MNIKNIIGTTVLVLGTTISATSCMNGDARNMYASRKELLENVMQDRPQKELDSLKQTFHIETYAAETQRAADSIVFQNMFKSTQRAKDSTFIKDYNKMISNTKTPTCFDVIMRNFVPDDDKMEQKLKDVLNDKDMKNISKNPLMEERNYYGIGRQYLVDSVYHHKFFEKHNMLDKEGLKQFKALCKKVKP